MATECKHDKSCIELFEKLSEYLDHELDEGTCADIEKHAGECISCKVCLETLKRTIALCKKLDAPQIPEAFSRRLKDTITQMQRST